jgi:hypothetical protein
MKEVIVGKPKEKIEDVDLENRERLSLAETWPADEYDPNAIPPESVAHPDNLGPSPITPEQMGVTEEPKRQRKPRELTPLKLAAVAETRIKRLREQAAQRRDMLRRQLDGELVAERQAMQRLLSEYPRDVIDALVVLKVIVQEDIVRPDADAAH